MSRKHEKKPSKRQAIREKRKRDEQRRRLITIGSIVAVALVLVALLIIPTIRDLTAPVGEFTTITPVVHEITDGQSMGDPNAPVKIVVFEDFQCSACKNFAELIEPSIISELVDTGKVHYTFRNYPFLDDGSNIKDSDNAAMATMCANEQGKFWEMNQLLFANYGYGPGGFSKKRLSAFAESLGLDVEEFDTCINDKRYKDEIDSDLQAGLSLGVTGTPSVYVNGVIVRPGYVPTFEEILAAVETILAQ